MLLKVHAILLTMPSLFRWYMAGVFTGSFLPGEVSGDLVRGYFAGHGVANKAAVWTSIVVERLSGIAGMTLLAILVLVAAPSLLGWNPIIVLLLVAVVVLGCWIGLLLLLRTEVPQWVPLRIKPALLRVREALTAYLAHPDILFLCLGLSVIYHLLTVISLWFILLALMPDPPFSVAFVSPLVGMVGLLPLTPGGLGLREGVLAVLLERAGLPGGVALASSVLSRMLLWLVALTGLPVLLTEPQVFKYLQASRNSQS